MPAKALRLLALAALGGLGLPASTTGAAPPPGAVAWLWDGAGVPSWSQAEVAVVTDHYLLRADRLLHRPRMHSPDLLPATRVTPVVHVELSTVNPPVDPARHRQALLDAVLRAASRSTAGRVQLDMEARPSQRLFHRQLVQDIRAALPPTIQLSVTALAWWCRHPGWLQGLAADEVVPMYFRMGRDSTALRALVQHSPGQLHAACRQGAAGFSVQEEFDPAVPRRYGRTYWFDDRRWRDKPKTTSTP